MTWGGWRISLPSPPKKTYGPKRDWTSNLVCVFFFFESQNSCRSETSFFFCWMFASMCFLNWFPYVFDHFSCFKHPSTCNCMLEVAFRPCWPSMKDNHHCYEISLYLGYTPHPIAVANENFLVGFPTKRYDNPDGDWNPGWRGYLDLHQFNSTYLCNIYVHLSMCYLKIEGMALSLLEKPL